MSVKSVAQSAIILTAAGLATRVLGFVYRIYLSNAIGAEGMGLYQLIMPVYSLAWSVSCAGFTTAISKLTAAEKARGGYGNIWRIIKICVLISTVIAVSLSYVLYFFASQTALFFFKDERVILPLKVLALCFPAMAAGSCLRGFFYGMRESVVPAINQVLEQCVRMAVIFFIAQYFIPHGLTYACAACVIGIVAEEVFSFLFVFASYRKFKQSCRFEQKPSLSYKNALKMILAICLPLAGNRISGSLLGALENTLMPQRLAIFSGSGADAMASFGKLSGMAMPLIFFPSAFLSSVSVSLLPVISEAHATNNMKRINRTVSKTILFTAVVGIGAAGLFTVFSREMGSAVYNQDIGHYLRILGVMCPFLYIQMTISGILNGLGFQVFIFRNSLLSSIITILFVYFYVPVKGVDGFLLGWFVSLLITCALDLYKLKKNVIIGINFSDLIIKPLLSSFLASLAARLLAIHFLFEKFGRLAGLIIAVILICGLYAGLIVVTGCVMPEDIRIIFPAKKRK
jgi:stage V sporulation protein B